MLCFLSSPFFNKVVVQQSSSSISVLLPVLIMNRACNLGSAVSYVLCLTYNLVKFTLFMTLFKKSYCFIQI